LPFLDVSITFVEIINESPMLAVASIKFDEINQNEELKFIHDIKLEHIFDQHSYIDLKDYCRDDDVFYMFFVMTGISQKAIKWLQKAKVLFGTDAARHLFKVTSGLDSRLLGDYEISAQVRDAAQLSKKFKCLGGEWENLVNKALAVSKEVKTQTNICKGFVSYASVAANAAMLKFGSLSNKKIVVYGTGKIGANLVECMTKHTDARDVVLVNRTLQKAIDLSQKYQLKYAPESELASVLKDADLLFVATASNEFLIKNYSLFGSKIDWIADLSQPSNVSPNVRKDGVQLLDLNTLTSLFEQNMDERKRELPAAMEIVEKHIEELQKRERLNQYLTHALSWVEMGYETTFDSSSVDSTKGFVQHFMKQMNPLVKQQQDSACAFLRVMNEMGVDQNPN
jgi:glutamyl-tRNA reductase